MPSSAFLPFAAVFSVEQGSQSVDALAPEHSPPFEPGGGFVQPPRIEGQKVTSSGAPAAAEAGALEDADVLRNGVERYREGLGHLRHACLSSGKPIEDRPARPVGERDQGVIKLRVKHSPI